MGRKEVIERPKIYPLPEPKGEPKITNKLFKAIHPRRHPLGQATFGIYGDPGR